jgi:hypothetical protein
MGSDNQSAVASKSLQKPEVPHRVAPAPSGEKNASDRTAGLQDGYVKGVIAILN